MRLKKQSLATGKINERDVDVTPEQMHAWQHGGVLIQDAMPHLSPDDREFIMTGITPDEWEELFGDEKNEPIHVSGSIVAGHKNEYGN